MNLARSTYYYRLKEPPVTQRKDDADLLDVIEAIAVEWPRYGYRRMTEELNDTHRIHVNHKRVARIMRENGLQCRVKKKWWIQTTDSNHQFRIYPNRIKRLAIKRINQVWVADITYIRLLTEFVYLAVIMDLFSRRIIGWALSRSLEAELACAALRMAIEERKPPHGCIHHSDRGVQYASQAYVDILKNAGLEISMSRKGNPYDNAAMESFMKTLKQEEVYLWDYRTMADAIERLPQFLEKVYNQKRRHSSLDYKSPVQFENLQELKLKNAAGLPKKTCSVSNARGSLQSSRSKEWNQ